MMKGEKNLDYSNEFILFSFFGGWDWKAFGNSM